jgi:hypothetical protein
MAFWLQQTRKEAFHLRNSPPLIFWLIVLLIISAVLYFIWPYLVAFLAILGLIQLLRIWQRNKSNRNFRK